MTADPSTVQGARLAIGSIREALPVLVEARNAPLTRERRYPRPLGKAAAARLDELVAAERLDRLGQLRHGYIPRPAIPVPARLAVVDVEQQLRTTLGDLCWLASSQLRARWELIWAPNAPAAVPFDAHLDYLTVAVGHVDQGLAAQTEKELDDASRLLLDVLRLSAVWIPLPRRCPACDRRSLRGYLESPNVHEWTVICHGAQPACICAGVDCPCQRPGRRPATRHLWSATQIRHLGRIAPPANGAAA